MTLAEMIAKLQKENREETLGVQHRLWAGRMAVMVAEIDRRLTALEAAANGAPRAEDAAPPAAGFYLCAERVVLPNGVELREGDSLRVARTADGWRVEVQWQ